MTKYRKNEAQDWAWENLKGQWTTLFTPFDSDNKVDEEALRHNIRHIRGLGTRGAGCTWGMGEFWSLTQDERRRVMEIVSDEANGEWPIAAHITDTSLEEMVSLAAYAEQREFDLLIVAPSYFVTKTEDQVVEFTRQVAAKTDLAIMFYNSPQFGIVLSPQGLKRITDIPNVVGVKEASFNQQTSLETHLSLGKTSIISTPDEWIYWKEQELGFHQQVMFANTSDWRFDTHGENYYVQFIEKASQGELDTALYDSHLRRIKQLSDKWWGDTVKKAGGALPVALAKAWGEMMGLKAGSVRPPLSDLSQQEKLDLRFELEQVRPQIKRGSPPQTSSKRNGNGQVPFIYQNGSAHQDVVDSSGMLLMVSVQNMAEALEAERGGADVIDVKNLQEALVGSGHPILVKEARDAIPAEKHVSVTLGVVPNQAGTVAMAVYAAAQLQATSVKVGFMNTDYDEAVQILRDSKTALHGTETKLVGSLFADNLLYEGGLEPRMMNQLALETGCDGWLIDTLIKDGRNLFDFIPENELREMVLEGKSHGMSTALSGHLRMSDIDELARINPDIVGVRGAVCQKGDRDTDVAWEAVAQFRNEILKRKNGEIDPYAALVDDDKPQIISDGLDGHWVVLDGRGKSCAGILAALSDQTARDNESFVETILGDRLNSYDVTMWAEKEGHNVLTQREDIDGSLRMLIQPKK